jgi:hypothetical protein
MNGTTEAALFGERLRRRGRHAGVAGLGVPPVRQARMRPVSRRMTFAACATGRRV